MISSSLETHIQTLLPKKGLACFHQRQLAKALKRVLFEQVVMLDNVHADKYLTWICRGAGPYSSCLADFNSCQSSFKAHQSTLRGTALVLDRRSTAWIALHVGE